MFLYKNLMGVSAPALKLVLKRRVKAGKEDPARLPERMGRPALPRPAGPLIWLHAASVGESQSALTLIHALLAAYPGLRVLVTTGTRTSAELMEKRLPPHAFHQYMPLDHPDWCAQFLNHWTPDSVLWMESELWPNMLSGLQARAIPAALINARLSDRSFKRWKRASKTARQILSAFQIVMCQSPRDQARFDALGAARTIVTDNIKYSAPPLPVNETAAHALDAAIGPRPLWVYASTHDGEEALAARVHEDLKDEIPNILTLIVPRHPHRGEEIEKELFETGLTITRRTEDKILPDAQSDIYIADTLGEMGIFYDISDIVMVGRSFSKDGGGGHNLIEPAQFGCAVLTGPNVQFQQDIARDMRDSDALLQVQDEDALTTALLELFEKPDALDRAKDNAQRFAQHKAGVINLVMDALTPVLNAIPRLKERA